MRWIVVVWVVLGFTAVGPARGDNAKPARRYGIEAELDQYPQDTAKSALASVIKAIEGRRIDYLLAQLADPKFVDERLKKTGESFAELVKETNAKLTSDPAELRDLKRLAGAGVWEEGDNSASVGLDDLKDRRVYLRKDGARWYFENRTK